MRVVMTQATPGRLSRRKPAANQRRRCQQPQREPHPDTSHPAILTRAYADSKPADSTSYWAELCSSAPSAHPPRWAARTGC